MSNKIEKIKSLQIELEELRVKKTVAIKDFQEEKDKEIENYITKTINSNSTFYVGYGSMLRKDLEQQYDKRLQEIKDEFSAKEQELISKIETLENEEELNFHHPQKNEEEQVELILQLKQEQMKFDSIMEELSNFKYEYNDQNQVINGADWRELYKKSNEISNKMNEIRKKLDSSERQIKPMELTKEEKENILVTMGSFQESEKTEIDDEKDVFVDDNLSLLKKLLEDIINQIQSLKSIKLENIDKNQVVMNSQDSLKLPCGEYFTNSDLNDAIDRLYTKNKGTTYIVNETGKEYEINKSTVQKFKIELKKCSMDRLIKDKKISQLDLLRSYGKQKSEEIIKEMENVVLNSTKVSNGDYVEKSEVINAISNLIIEKEPYWLKDIFELLKNNNQNIEKEGLNEKSKIMK